MARRKKVLEVKDYDLLINNLEQEVNEIYEEIANKKQLISEKKKEIKKLCKERDAYELQKEKEEKENAVKEMAEQILSSGKTLEEIKELLSSTSKNKSKEK